MTPTYQNLGGFCGSNQVQRTDDPNIQLFVTRINTKDDQKIYLRLFDTRTNVYGPAKQVVSKKAGDFTLNLGPGSAIILPNGEALIALAGGQGGDDLLAGHLRVPSVGPTGQPADGKSYTFVNSATDQVARDAANAAGSTGGKALQLASQAMERFKELEKQLKNLPTAASVKPADVLKIVSDDIANDQGTLRHALFPRVQKMLADGIYAMLKDAASPLINVIKQGGTPIK